MLNRLNLYPHYRPEHWVLKRKEKPKNKNMALLSVNLLPLAQIERIFGFSHKCVLLIYLHRYRLWVESIVLIDKSNYKIKINC